jgi:SAM-dependent methyltransferase
MNDENEKLIKTEFDFGWKKWDNVPLYAEKAMKYQKGDILDIGCATCELYIYLRSNGWKGKYFGLDIQKYDNYKYPDGVELIIGDPLKIKLPNVDTVVLYNILEHVDNPLLLIKKALEISRKNVLINVPKRNEELWKLNIVEYHQLDKSHKHNGFSKEEIFKLVDLAGGKIRNYQELGEINSMIGIQLWNSKIPKLANILLQRIFSSKTFNLEIWSEIVKK